MQVVITGTSRGIGRGLVDWFLQQGHCVAGCSRSELDIETDGYTHYIVDVATEESVQEFVGKLRKTMPVVDVLINNAGIAAMNHVLLTPGDTARRVMDVNFHGTFTMSREVARLMRKSSAPRIINFSTVAVPLNLAGEAVYAASKSAVETLTRVLAKELAQYRIRVNAIGPTPIQTDLIASVSEEKIQELVNQQAIKRLGTLEDIVNLIEFLIRPQSDFITGQTIYLGGVS